MAIMSSESNEPAVLAGPLGALHLQLARPASVLSVPASAAKALWTSLSFPAESPNHPGMQPVNPNRGDLYSLPEMQRTLATVALAKRRTHH